MTSRETTRIVAGQEVAGLEKLHKVLSLNGQISIEMATVWPIGHFTENLTCRRRRVAEAWSCAGAIWVVLVPTEPGEPPDGYI